MLFSEPAFLFLFLPASLLLYHAAPAPARNTLLTLLSLLFYASGEIRFLPLMLLSIAVNYWVAVGIDRYRGTPWAWRLLVLGVASDLALLLVFKYTNWLAAELNGLLRAVHLAAVPLPSILLPLGISFFTFHKISYKVDVYRQEAALRKNPGDLALYILFFPQLIAGPIVRYHEIADQLVRRTVTRPGFVAGVERFILGLGKKMILANTVAFAADRIFALPAAELTTPVAWLGLACYTLQIYYDFSGYSDMAIGLAAMFGFTFPENFNHPYAATSITEFWRRWHMSLSRWFRDYLYIPLGGNRCGPRRTYLNLVIVFLLCGLWHGASWNFLVWGLLHGGLLVAERLGWGRLLERMPRSIAWGYTLLAVLLGWVFFRAETLPAAGAFLAALAGAGSPSPVQHVGLYFEPWFVLVFVTAWIFVFPVRRGLIRAGVRWMDGLPAAGRIGAGWAAHGLSLVTLAAAFTLSAMLMAAGTYNPFIYFRF